MACDSVDLEEESPVPTTDAPFGSGAEPAPVEATAPPIEEEPPAQPEPEQQQQETETEPGKPVEDQAAIKPEETRPAIESILNPVTLPCAFVVGDSRTDWRLDVSQDNWREQLATMLRTIAQDLHPQPHQIAWPPVSDDDLMRLLTAAQNGGVAPVVT